MNYMTIVKGEEHSFFESKEDADNFVAGFEEGGYVVEFNRLFILDEECANDSVSEEVT